jgi:hypothetical protein
MNKKIILSIIVVAVLVVLYIIIGRQIPIHRSDLKVGSERIYYHETSRLVSCDLAFTEVVVHEDENNQYVYELINIGNGSCKSDLYVWKGLKSYTIKEAIEKGIMSLDDFLESSFVITRPIVEE